MIVVEEKFDAECVQTNERLLRREIRTINTLWRLGNIPSCRMLRSRAQNAFMTGEMSYHEFFGWRARDTDMCYRTLSE